MGSGGDRNFFSLNSQLGSGALNSIPHVEDNCCMQTVIFGFHSFFFVCYIKHKATFDIVDMND